MTLPKPGIKTAVSGGAVGIGLVLNILWGAIGDAEERVTAAHDKDVAVIRAEVAKPLQGMERELCRMRFRMDVRDGVPNPGGCE